MFALLVADKTLDNDWAGDYYARSPSKALNSADALYASLGPAPALCPCSACALLLVASMPACRRVRAQGSH